MWSLRSERQRKTARFAPLFHTTRSSALILLLKEAKPATGRKRLHCNVCLACVCVCGTSRAEGGEAAGVELETSCLCTAFKVSGALHAHSLQHNCEGDIQNKTIKPTPRLLFFSLPPLLSSGHHITVYSF